MSLSRGMQLRPRWSSARPGQGNASIHSTRSGGRLGSRTRPGSRRSGRGGQVAPHRAPPALTESGLNRRLFPVDRHALDLGRDQDPGTKLDRVRLGQPSPGAVGRSKRVDVAGYGRANAIPTPPLQFVSDSRSTSSLARRRARSLRSWGEIVCTMPASLLRCCSIIASVNRMPSAVRPTS